MTEESKTTDEREPKSADTRPRFRPLTAMERGGAIIAGVGIGTTGFVAMFVTKNEAGIAIAILLAGVLILLGIQGTPLTKLGFKDYSFEMMQREEARLEVAGRAFIEADSNPTLAQGMLNGYQVADPDAQKSSAIAQVSGIVYERRVLNLFPLLAPEFTIVEQRGGDSGIDARLILPEGGSVDALIKYTKAPHLEMSTGAFKRLLSQAALAGTSNLLLISNGYPPRNINDIVARFQDEQEIRVHYVRWSGDADDRTLALGVRRFLAQIRNEAPSSNA